MIPLTNKEVGERIRSIRKQKGYTAEYVAEKLGMSKSNFTKYERGIAKRIDREFILKIASVLGTDVAIINGLNDDRLPQNNKSKIAIRIPVLGRIPAGVPIDAIEDILDWEELDPRQFNPDNDYFGLIVRGDSMYPIYLEGDVIIVQQTEDAESGKDVVAYVNGYEATLKRLYKYENGSIELRAINPSYESKKFTIEEVREEPVVIRGFVKELRRGM